MSDTVREIQAGQFEAEVHAATEPVVLDFFSTECPPCEALAPKFEAVAEQFKGRVRFLKIFRQGSRELERAIMQAERPTRIRHCPHAGFKFQANHVPGLPGLVEVDPAAFLMGISASGFHLDGAGPAGPAE